MNLRWLIAAALLAACSPDRERVVVWHAYAGAERAALEEVAAAWNAAHPDQGLSVVAMPHGVLADKATMAIPNGNGPDLILYGHDRIGAWVDASLIEPLEFWVDDTVADRYERHAIAPLAHDGSLYGLPLATKTLALYYRTDLIDRPPATTDELLAIAGTLEGARPLAYATELYYHAAWLFGFGGGIFDDDGDLALATPGAIAAGRFARELVVRGVAPVEIEGSELAPLFKAGEVAMVISGPWFAGDIAPGVPWAVAPLPVVSDTGAPATPFLTAEGVMMSARARDKDAAFAALDYLTGDASAVMRARRARQVVANVAAYDDAEVAADPVVAAFRAQAARATPMPKSLLMNAVWTPYESALKSILRGGDVGDALRGAERQVVEGP